MENVQKKKQIEKVYMYIPHIFLLSPTKMELDFVILLLYNCKHLI